MALVFNTPEREIFVRGTITLASGKTITLSPNNIMSYSISERSASNGFALGETQSASYSLEVDNSEHELNAYDVDGATVELHAQIIRGTSIAVTAFGVWTVSSADISEQSATAHLSGGDALEFNFDQEFDELMQMLGAAKGKTLGSLLQFVCDQAGVTLGTTSFLNSDAVLTGNEKWQDGTTLRDVVSYIAAAAGGFARIARDGTLEIVSYSASTNVGTVTADTYITLNCGDGTVFDFKQIAVKYIGEETWAYFPIGSTSKANTTLQVTDNPLYNTSIATTVGYALVGMYAEPISMEWVGDPTVMPGDVITVQDISGNSHDILVNSQTISYDGGIYATTQCQLSKLNATSSGYRPNSTVNQAVTSAVNNIFRRDDEPTEGNVGDLWIQPMSGQIFQCSSVASENVELPTFTLNEGDLEYTLPDGQEYPTMYINEDGELMYDGVTYALSIDESGNLTVASEMQWDLVQDKAIAGNLIGLNENALTKDEFEYYIRPSGTNGVEVGRNDSNGKLLLTNAGVDIKVGGNTFSRFTSSYVQFGDYQIRRSTNGALVIKKAREAGEGVSALLLK